ncbi:hypothetical protein SAY86_025862 [Trapa natans]|uniref:DUF4408 domain-containing protein n=1 Tax=Trapa natans TaxID=22666 RepID=A0AAN7KET1_TRANT|nr:hypothetical protein SAY86_025862 [Trapa natans]
MADPSALASLWVVLAGWFNPTPLFLFVNLMIGTIVISSRFHGHSSKQPAGAYHQLDHRQGHFDLQPVLFRSPSRLDRIRSFNFSVFKFDHHHTEPDYHYQPESSDFAGRANTDRAPASSLLQRLKSSISFAHPACAFHSDESVPEPQYVQHQPPSAHAPSPSMIQRLKSFNFSQYRYDQQDPVPESEQARALTSQKDPPSLARRPSFLDRVKSVNFSLFGQDEPDQADHADTTDHQATRVNSNTRPRKGDAPTRLTGKMNKSESDRTSVIYFKAEEDEIEDLASELGKKRGHVGAAAEEEEGEEEEIDARADDFINRFKQQLRLQRLDSILRYKEMFNRSSAR